MNETCTDISSGRSNSGSGIYTHSKQEAPISKGSMRAPDRIESYLCPFKKTSKEIADAGVFFANEPWEIFAASGRNCHG